MIRHIGIYLTFTVFLLLGATPVAAEPQILGLIASLEPVTLQCLRGKCSAEFTSYCIERHRQPPNNGTVYNIHDPATLIVEGLRENGEIVQFQASDVLDIASARGRSAIRMGVPASFLREFGLASLQITVGERATLIPDVNPDARRPHSALDITLATGPLRNLSALIIDHGGDRVFAARQTAKLINALPPGGRANETQRDGVWQSVALPAVTPGHGLVEAGFERCYRVTRSGMMSLRQCLGSLHDRFISKLNVDYWKAVETGS
ncbi:MAG: hypothetical protein VCD33_02360 [Alphaproteobacteria bacterium]